jgi:hypothetical protein
MRVDITTSNFTTPSDAVHQGACVTDLHATNIWDACLTQDASYPNTTVIAYRRLDGNINVEWFDNTFTSRRTAAILNGPVEALAVVSMDDHNTGDTHVVVLWDDGGVNTIKMQMFNDSGGALGGITQISATTFNRVVNITAAADPSHDSGTPANSSFRVYIEESQSVAAFFPFANGILTNTHDSWNNVHQVVCQFDRAAFQDDQTIWNSSLASKAFTHDSKSWVWTCSHPCNQNTTGAIFGKGYGGAYYLKVSGDSGWPETAATMLQERCNGTTNPITGGYGACLPQAYVDGSILAGDSSFFVGLFSWTGGVRPELNEGGGIFERPRWIEYINAMNITAIRIRPYLTNNGHRPDVFATKFGAGSCLISGLGVTSIVNGNAFEAGFLKYPAGFQVDQIGGGNPPVGTYTWAVTYEWTDQDGNVFASNPVFATIDTTPHGQGPYDLLVKTLIDTHENKVDNVNLVVYRNAADGSMRKIGTYTVNDKTVQYVTIRDSTTAANLVGREVLYTDNGEFANHMIPPSSYSMVSGNRLFLISQEDKRTIFASKKIVPGTGLGYSSFFSINIPYDGRAVGLAEIAKKIIIFCDNRILVFWGDGPNNFGVGQFSDLQEITSEFGCSDSNSILKIPQGIVFLSESGFHLLQNNLVVTKIGDPVSTIANNAIVEFSAFIKERSEARFYLDKVNSGNCLVLDTDKMVWSVHPGQYMITGGYVDSELRDGTESFVTYRNDFGAEINGFQEEYGGTWTDTRALLSTPYSMKVRTPWVRLSGLTGYQRVYWISIIGEYKSAHTLNVKVYYDYDDTRSETFTNVMSASPGGPYLFRMKPAIQKCRSISVEVWDSIQGGSKESFSISGIELEVGLKSQISKEGSAKTL